MAKNKPAHEARFGSIKATVWRNDTDKGVRFNTTFSRVYKDGEDWKSSDSFGRDDLLPVREAAREAFLWIHRQTQEDQQENGKQSSRK